MTLLNLLRVFQTQLLIILIISFSVIGLGILIHDSSAQEDIQIPIWIKDVAKWWADDKVSEMEFLNGIEYLINNQIIPIEFMPCSQINTESGTFNKAVPSWIKNNAGWWATDQIDDADFLYGIEYFIQKQIISLDNQKIKSKIPFEQIRFSDAWDVTNIDSLSYVSSAFFEIYGETGSCILDDGRLKWNSILLALNPLRMEQYEAVAVWDHPEKIIVVYPYFTHAAYHEPGFYTYYAGLCDHCTTTELVPARSTYTSSGKGHQALTLLGYDSITDVTLDRNPSILQQFDKVVMLHNEYVTRAMFDAVTNHPNVIYLYPNALYAEIEVDYEDETITLIRGHGYPEPNIANGFTHCENCGDDGWEFDNTHPYEYDSDCLNMEFYQIKNGWMLNCYPENVFVQDSQDLFNLLLLIKHL